MRYIVDVYKNDCILIRKYQYKPQVPDGARQEIEEFSYKSRRRLAFVANNTDVQFRTMITLTYPRDFPGDGKDVKRHLRNMIRWLRHNVEHVSYLWFLEFQKRGAPHIHMLLNCPERVLPKKKDISIAWARIVDSGDKRHLLAGTRTETLRTSDGGARYATKYAMKMYQKEVPEEYRNVGRFWAHSTDVKPNCKEKRGYFYFDDLQNDLRDWRYKRHLANPRVSTLYNAAKDISKHDKAKPGNNGKGHCPTKPDRVYNVLSSLVDTGDFDCHDSLFRRIRWRAIFNISCRSRFVVPYRLRASYNVPSKPMAANEHSYALPPTPKKSH